jgi:hypothetical protein
MSSMIGWFATYVALMETVHSSNVAQGLGYGLNLASKRSSKSLIR